MGQLANPIGQRIGRGRGNYVWSDNISFFYFKSSYKRTIILFRYLSLIFKKFGVFLRRLYRRPVFPARPTYNIVGYGEGGRSLVVGLAIFDYFSVMRRMPIRAWGRYARRRRWGSMSRRDMKNFVRYRLNRLKGGLTTTLSVEVKNLFRLTLPYFKVRFVMPTMPIISIKARGGVRSSFIRFSGGGGGISTSPLFRVARSTLFEGAERLVDPRAEPDRSTVQPLVRKYLMKAVVNTALYLELRRWRKGGGSKIRFGKSLAKGRGRRGRGRSKNAVRRGVTTPTPPLATPRRSHTVSLLSRILTQLMAGGKGRGRSSATGRTSVGGRTFRGGVGDHSNRNRQRPHHPTPTTNRFQSVPSFVNFNRGRYPGPLRLFRKGRGGKSPRRGKGGRGGRRGKIKGGALYRKRLHKYMSLPAHLKQIRSFRFRRSPLRQLSRYIQFSRLGYRLSALSRLYIQGLRRGVVFSLKGNKRRKVLLPLHQLLPALSRLGPGYDFLARTFVFKSSIFARLASKFWFYIFQVFFYRVFDGLMVHNGLSQLTLQFFAIKQMASAYMIVIHIVRELKKGFKVPFVFRQVRKGLRLLMRTKRIFAYKLLFAGRFTRRQMATYYWRSQGPLSLNSDGAKVDYASRHFVAKYGLCAVKVWLSYR